MRGAVLAAAALGLCALVVALVVAAAPEAGQGCPPGQRVAVTGHSKVLIGGRRARVPDYGCEVRP